jgi:hypothetical protein
MLENIFNECTILKPRMTIFIILFNFMLMTFGEGASIDALPQSWAARIFVFVIVFTLFPYAINLWQTHKCRMEKKEYLIRFVKKHPDKINKDIYALIHNYCKSKPIDVRRIAYDAIALTITLAVTLAIGISLFLLLSHPAIEPANPSIKEVLLALAVGISLFLLLSHLAIEQHFH